MSEADGTRNPVYRHFVRVRRYGPDLLEPQAADTAVGAQFEMEQNHHGSHVYRPVLLARRTRPRSDGWPFRERLPANFAGSRKANQNVLGGLHLVGLRPLLALDGDEGDGHGA